MEARELEGHAARTASPAGDPLKHELRALRRLLGSVRFGLVLLGLLLALCMLGMVIMQSEMAGFEEYYASLSKAQKTVYGRLGLFDVYGSWYFATLLVLTGLNIVLSSVDRFPAAWRYLRRPRVTASPAYLRRQPVSSELELDEKPEPVLERLVAAMRQRGLAPRLTTRAGRVSVFAERHAWNRLGAYAVHVALLMIFAGGFLTSQLAVSGVITIEPGSGTDTFVSFDQELGKQTSRELKLPFRVECTDIQQRLIDPEGGLDPSNTIDWLSRVRIADAAGTSEALIHLNEPLDHRGYRFFQSSFEPEGSARAVTLRLEAPDGSARDIALQRNEVLDVPGAGRITYEQFYPDFQFVGGRPATRSGEYNNPVAQLRVTAPDGKTRPLFAFSPDVAETLSASNHGHAAAFMLAGDQTITLESYEKVAKSHLLRVQYDPGKNLVYAGFLLLVVSLALVFAFSHERFWAVVEPAGSGSRISLGAHTNRNVAALRARFTAIASDIEESGAKV